MREATQAQLQAGNPSHRGDAQESRHEAAAARSRLGRIRGLLQPAPDQTAMQPDAPETYRMRGAQERVGKPGRVVAQDKREIDRRAPKLVRGRDANGYAPCVYPQRGLPRIEHLVRPVAESLRQVDVLRIKTVGIRQPSALAVGQERESGVLRTKGNRRHGQRQRPVSSSEPSLDGGRDSTPGPERAVVPTVRER